MNRTVKKYKVNVEKQDICKKILEKEDIIIWKWSLGENTLFLSCKAEDIFENKVSEIHNLYELIQIYAIEKDKKSAKNDLDFYLNGNSYIFQSEFRIICKESKHKWIRIKGRSEKGINGKIKELSGTIFDITASKEFEDEIKNLAYYDALTELPNKNLLKFKLLSLLKETKANNVKGVLILLDIDNFKSVNEVYGNEYGDLLLKLFSQILYICVNNYGEVYKLGGDKFILLINQFESIKQIENLCNTIMDYCKNPFEVKDEQIYISVSMGITVFPSDSSDIYELFKYAELSVVESKCNGKNRYTFFNTEIFNVYSRKLIIEQELINVIEKNELYLVYQPQIDAKNNKVIGLEALLRWNNSKLGNVSPVEFIPLAEKNGTIIKIGEWVLYSVCNKIKELNSKEYKFGTISLNVSPIQLKKPGFVEVILRACEEEHLDYNNLEIEITESTLINLHNDNIEVLNKLIDNGIKISIDDFGTGYSSLNYLAMLPISTLKIDKSFIDNIEKEKNRAVVNCIIELSKALKYKIIAEGVETKKQLELLLNLGCNNIQGYYFSKPILGDKIYDLLNRF